MSEWRLSWLFGLTRCICSHAKELCLNKGQTEVLYLCTLYCSLVNMQRIQVPVLDDWSLKVCLYFESLERRRGIIAEEWICSVWPGSLKKVCRKLFILDFNWWHEMLLHFVRCLILPALGLLSRSMRRGLSPRSLSAIQSCSNTIHHPDQGLRDLLPLAHMSAYTPRSGICLPSDVNWWSFN